MNRADTAGWALAYLGVAALCVTLGRLGGVVGDGWTTIGAGVAACLWATGMALVMIYDE